MIAPKLTEAEWQRQVTDLAELYSWLWVHFRPAQTAKGWRTPVSGPLGKGWPDLILTRKGRVVFAELKTAAGKTSDTQLWVMERLRAGGAEAYIWRPADFDSIAETLR